MEIVVNGEKRTVPDGLTVAILVDELRVPGRRMAVEVNEEVVPRGEYAAHALADGDRIEIVHAVGGG